MAEQDLNIDQAVENIRSVLSEYRGSLGEHMALQKSLNMVKDAVAVMKVMKPKFEQKIDEKAKV